MVLDESWDSSPIKIGRIQNSLVRLPAGRCTPGNPRGHPFLPDSDSGAFRRTVRYRGPVSWASHPGGLGPP